MKQNEPEAQRIATALEMYVTGSLNVFNHRTNVDRNNRLICFDIKELGKQLKKLGMLVVQDCVWNRVTVNRAEHIAATAVGATIGTIAIIRKAKANKAAMQ